MSLSALRDGFECLLNGQIELFGHIMRSFLRLKGLKGRNGDSFRLKKVRPEILINHGKDFSSYITIVVLAGFSYAQTTSEHGPQINEGPLLVG